MNTKVIKTLLFLLIISISIFSCDDRKSQKNTGKKKLVALKVKSPGHNEHLTVGEPLNIVLEVYKPEEINNLTITYNDSIYFSQLSAKSQSISIDTKPLPVGFSTLKISYTDQAGKPRTASRNIVMWSDITPEQKIASIVNTYPHQTSSYTQGLEFYKGNLYESTGSGDNNQSFIAKVDLLTGEHEQYKILDKSNFFGEGITILNDTIYQLTWQNNECLVYDLNFNYIKSYSYEGEGWGLTNNGQSLIMSNGTSSIVWRNRHTFEIEKTIHVFSKERDVPQLNELELINGDLWCNVYMDEFLVQVDTTTGKVLAYIDCSGIAMQGMDVNSNVLNGIAYEANTKKIYLTGKLWPKLFEVKID
jgi:glutamine cyclotransferase